MKKTSLAVCAVVAAFLGTIAPRSDAQEIKKPIAARLIKLLSTKVTGTINVNPAQQLAGIQCSDLTVYATSVEMLPPPPGGFSTQHKWTRSAAASGTDINACSYSIAVPGNSNFNLSLGSDSTDKCQTVGGQPVPNAYVVVTVPTGTTKSFNFTSNLLCQNVN